MGKINFADGFNGRKQDWRSGLARAYRNKKYLKWLKQQKCWSCPSVGNGYNPIDPSHIFRGYHGLKNHDWAAIPQCRACHTEMENFSWRFKVRHEMPTAKDAEKYFQRFLKETGGLDDRQPNQMGPI